MKSLLKYKEGKNSNYRWNDLKNRIIWIILNRISLNEWRKYSLKLIWFSIKRKILYPYKKIVQNWYRIWH